jgi:hypothetical protein
MYPPCLTQRRYEEIWDEDNESKIRAELGPSEDGYRKIMDPPPYIGKEAPLKHYKEYKRLERTLLRKDFNSSIVAASEPKQPILG